jgi:hypothetical protein
VTCIVGAVDPVTGDVYIGGDSSAVAEYDMLTISTPKVFMKHGFVYGFAGHFRFGQILQYSFIPPKYKGGDIAEYMSRDFMTALRETARDAGFLKCIEGRDRGGLVLVGFRGHLFLMQDEFEIIEIHNNIASIGCGYPYALGAMRALEDAARDVPVAARIEAALEISEYYSGGVRAPFTVLRLENAGKQQARKGNSRGDRAGTKKLPRRTTGTS